jgi:hypothetical protein
MSLNFALQTCFAVHISILRRGSSPYECDECADAQPQCREMRWRNINNLAVHTGHLYTRVNESHMFLIAYIHSPAWIVAQ